MRTDRIAAIVLGIVILIGCFVAGYYTAAYEARQMIEEVNK